MQILTTVVSNAVTTKTSDFVEGCRCIQINNDGTITRNGMVLLQYRDEYSTVLYGTVPV